MLLLIEHLIRFCLFMYVIYRIFAPLYTRFNVTCNPPRVMTDIVGEYDAATNTLLLCRNNVKQLSNIKIRMVVKSSDLTHCFDVCIKEKSIPLIIMPGDNLNVIIKFDDINVIKQNMWIVEMSNWSTTDNFLQLETIA